MMHPTTVARQAKVKTWTTLDWAGQAALEESGIKGATRVNRKDEFFEDLSCLDLLSKVSGSDRQKQT